MGKHHVQGETGFANDCLPLAWNNIFVNDVDLSRCKLDSDMLISECASMDFVKAGVMKIGDLCAKDGFFDISVLQSISRRIRANIDFIRSLHKSEGLIYSKLPIFRGILRVRGSHFYSLIRNPLNMDE